MEFEYNAEHEDELSFKPGDIIKNVRRIEEEGWMEGELNGKRGLFPDNFVKEIRKETKEDGKEVKEELQLRRRSSGNVASLVQRISTYGIPTGGLGLPPRTSKRKSKKRQCKVLFEYVPQNEDELALKVGDIIEVSDEVEDGWWSGMVNGKSGLFPSNFVKEMDGSEEDESNDAGDDSDGKDELTSPVSPHPGNGVIAQPKKVKGVGFGNIFREGSVKLKPRIPSETEEKKDKPIPPLPPTAKPVHLSSADTQRGEKDSENKGKVKEFCRGTFLYEATNEDELSIKEGDIIQILSKDTGEPGWWRGEINGREGVFPDNFVVKISDADKELLLSRGSMKQPSRPEVEEKPRKPPPPSKTAALKPEVPSADKKPTALRSEDKVDRVIPDKPTKPAPIVPPKKPVVPPGKSLLRPVSLQPKRPEKALTPSPVAKHNGELQPLTRPKSEIEVSVQNKAKPMSGDWTEKMNTPELMVFDDMSSSSEKLSHPTASRPKMPGRRLPGHFTGSHPLNKEAGEKASKSEDEEPSGPKSSEPWKPSAVHKPASVSSTQLGSKSDVVEERAGELEEMKAQIKELLLSVELLKNQQTRELSDLRNELDEERLKRVALQMEVEHLKKQVQST